ncbi:hypothetical protein [Ulvibacter antarcticus]|uniref:Uncharacterized protein n=1 Tax=Ulvibacter antarcticus TaxID=442714 RepID=A0A3L9YQL6_9FLAO|nr:hypothetical protein [Ulvibacter antarcticus]RMA56782.1 hypothetical protein BXY75_3301 [Ulvibacter antarcticus]
MEESKQAKRSIEAKLWDNTVSLLVSLAVLLILVELIFGANFINYDSISEMV